MAEACVSPTYAVSKLVTDSSVNGQPSSGYSLFGNDDEDETEPQFRDNVDRWRCHICHKVLRSPVQTVCGHRFCERCLMEYLPKDGSAVKCPADDKDECGMLSKGQLVSALEMNKVTQLLS